ncbi:MAG TPA: hypothetical protein VKY22_30455 [Bradyrhizobium sp.]|nr:hypothetical protein [Bradyrhizobium sp.]
MTATNGETQDFGTDLSIATACRAADVDYDDFTLAVAAGSYPCLPVDAGGAGRSFDETDLLALYIYGRLLSFGFGALRAGEYACRMHAALRANAHARVVSIALTTTGGKRVTVDVAASPAPAIFPGKLEFDIAAIRDFLKARIEAIPEGRPA